MSYSRARPAKRNAAPEYSVQVAVYRYLKAVLPGALVYAIENAQQPKSDSPGARMAFHQKRRAKGITNGAPDLQAILPGQLIAVEVKAPGGEVSAAQRDMHERMRRLGVIVIVADGIESLRWGLNHHRIALRETPGQPSCPPRVRYASRDDLVDDEIPL